MHSLRQGNPSANECPGSAANPRRFAECLRPRNTLNSEVTPQVDLARGQVSRPNPIPARLTKNPAGNTTPHASTQAQ
jgi:hypothetical protein